MTGRSGKFASYAYVKTLSIAEIRNLKNLNIPASSSMTTYSTEESSGTWYRKEPVTKGTSAIPNLVATKKRPIK